jgi:hypothetical protein
VNLIGRKSAPLGRHRQQIGMIEQDFGLDAS